MYALKRALNCRAILNAAGGLLLLLGAAALHGDFTGKSAF